MRLTINLEISGKKNSRKGSQRCMPRRQPTARRHLRSSWYEEWGDHDKIQLDESYSFRQWIFKCRTRRKIMALNQRKLLLLSVVDNVIFPLTIIRMMSAWPRWCCRCWWLRCSRWRSCRHSGGSICCSSGWTSGWLWETKWVNSSFSITRYMWRVRNTSLCLKVPLLNS